MTNSYKQPDFVELIDKVRALYSINQKELCTLLKVDFELAISPATLSKFKKFQSHGAYERDIKEKDFEKVSEILASIVSNPDRHKRSIKRILQKKKRDVGLINNAESELASHVGDYRFLRYNTELGKVIEIGISISYPFEHSAGQFDISKGSVYWETKAGLELGKQNGIGDVHYYEGCLSIRLQGKPETTLHCKLDTLYKAHAVYECLALEIHPMRHIPINDRGLLVSEQSYYSLNDQLSITTKLLKESLGGFEFGMVEGISTAEYLKKQDSMINQNRRVIDSLSGHLCYSYHLTDLDEQTVHTSAWKFENEFGRLKVSRFSREEGLYTGYCQIFTPGKISLELTAEVNSVASNEKMSYLFESQLLDEDELPKTLIALMLRLDRYKRPIAGKEVLALVTDQAKDKMTWSDMKDNCGIKYFKQESGLNPKIMSILVSNESSVLKAVSDKTFTANKLDGHFYVYYINGRKRLVRNKAIIKEYTNSIYFKYQSLNNTFKTIHVSKKEEVIFLAMKDLGSGNYFCLNLKYLASESRDNQILLGTGSSISHSRGVPVGQATVFVKSNEDYATMDCKEFSDSSKLSDQTRLLKEYLEFHKGNPIVVEPVGLKDIEKTNDVLKSDFIKESISLFKRYFSIKDINGPYNIILSEIEKLLKALKDRTEVSFSSSYAGVHSFLYSGFMESLRGKIDDKPNSISALSILDEGEIWGMKKGLFTEESIIQRFIQRGGKYIHTFLIEESYEELDHWKLAILCSHFDTYVRPQKNAELYLINVKSPEAKSSSGFLSSLRNFFIEDSNQTVWRMDVSSRGFVQGINIGFADVFEQGKMTMDRIRNLKVSQPFASTDCDKCLSILYENTANRE